MGIVTFNGISSDSLGIVVETPPGYSTPERDYDITHVMGRNGDVVIDMGSYQNVDRSYIIAVGSIESMDTSFVDLSNVVPEWLHSTSGYARLEDTYEPDYYRMAMYKEAIDITNIYEHAGQAEIVFNCKPQRFLTSGESSVSFTSSGTLTNPTNFTALPVITVTMTSGTSGVLYVGGYTVTIASGVTSLTIDCELQDAYSGTLNENSLITLNSGSFPKLAPGSNTVSFSGGITAVKIVPNWWTL